MRAGRDRVFSEAVDTEPSQGKERMLGGPGRTVELRAAALFGGLLLVTACATSGARFVNRVSPDEPPAWEPEPYLTVADGTAHMYEVTRLPDAEPTEEDYDAAWRLYSQSYDRARANGWFDFERAEAEGYESVDGLHYTLKPHLFDGHTLDPSRPESLLYHELPDAGGRRVLVGMMYIANSLSQEGPQVAGPLTVWHYHPWGSETCYEERISRLTAAAPVSCPPDAPKKFRGPEMLHVWFVQRPQGPFSSSMGIPPGVVEDLELPSKMTEEAFKRWARESFRRFER